MENRRRPPEPARLGGSRKAGSGLSRQRPPRGPLGSVRVRLVLLSFAITTAAVGFVYLYVVPQLTSRLTSERLERLEIEGAEELDRLRNAAGRRIGQRELAELVRRSAANVDARVTLLGVRAGEPAFVIADSEVESEAVQADYPAARGAAISNDVRSGIETVRGERIGQTAFPVSGSAPRLRGQESPGEEEDEGGSGDAIADGFETEPPGWVIVLSTPLADVEDIVALIRRQTLIAGGIALLLALIASYVAAGHHTRRLRRLEEAADRVAQGDFSVPIPVGGSDEVGQLALTLDQMQRRLRGLDMARREFIANASHELRTPIASLGGFVELLDEDPELDRETRAQFVRTMREQVERLTKLSTDLLDLSRLDADAVEVRAETIDLREIAEEISDEFAAAADQHGTVIEVEPGDGEVIARGDRARTTQIMRILTDNALKHTAPGTEITISSTTTDNECRVSVSDGGPGIDARSRERVFERFFTADGTTSGSGLGLAIGRELARLMGGELELERRRGRGATFTLSLPRAGARPRLGPEAGT